MLYLEILAVIFGLAYLFFLIREQIICWAFGIVGSLFSVILFYKTALYSEAILYLYYVVIGCYGFYHWNAPKTKNQSLPVTDFHNLSYVYQIVITEILAIILGFVFSKYTDAAMPYLDAQTTLFSFLASFLEARKKLSAWKFWIVINAVTIVLYLQKELNYYTVLTFVYLVFSFVGYYKWKKKMSQQTILV
ncbi:nicotinamide riboside transporter PnuC [Cognatitamlana onchidii]|uniref:nicotinamide riboside transporter PnuC n=1 Tax=Cognatitamlana onchidii TaxID=2562860 RepID=UPI0010A5D6CC|nr:nicotinamide riboside transporter PnuC [Algibacter onchidii]